MSVWSFFEKRRGVKIAISSIFAFGFFISIGVLIYGVSGLYFSGKYESKAMKRNDFYGYYKYNPETGESSKGMTTMMNGLKKEEDFKTYQDEEGNHILISKEGLTRYRCRGSCVCGSAEDDDRRSVTALSRPLFFLVAAATAAIASHRANLYFAEKCDDGRETYYKDECEGNVWHLYDDCYAEPADGVGPESEYRCFGTCLVHNWKELPPVTTDGLDLTENQISELQKGSDNFNCEMHSLTETVLCAFKFHCMRNFMSNILDPYCRESSYEQFTEGVDTYVIEDCVGHNGDLRNPSVWCFETGNEPSGEYEERERSTTSTLPERDWDDELPLR